MALEKITFNLGALEDSANSGKNYVSGQVFEVFNIDDTYADIFADSAGTIPIDQSGIQNISNSDGECKFFIDKGFYNIKSGGKTRQLNANFSFEFETISDAVNARFISLLEGRRVFIVERGVYFNVVSTLSVTPNGLDVIQSMSNSNYSLSRIQQGVDILLETLGLKSTTLNATSIFERAVELSVATGCAITYLNDLILDQVDINYPLKIKGIKTGDSAENQVTPSIKPSLTNTTTIFNVTRLGTNPTTDPINRELHLYGFNLEDVTFDGRNRSVQCDAVTLEFLDHSYWKNVIFNDFNGSSINFKHSVREMTFDSVVTRFCGNKDLGKPNLNFTADDLQAQDSCNNLYFNNCFFIFSMGDDVVFDSKNKPSTNLIRNVFFDTCFFHGLAPAIDGNPYSFSAASKAHIFCVAKGASRVRFSNSRMLLAGLDVPAIDIGTSAGGINSEDITYNGGEINGHYTGSVTSQGVLVRTNNDFACDNVSWYGHATANVRSQAGATVRYGTENKVYTGLGPDFTDQQSMQVYTKQILHEPLRFLAVASSSAANNELFRDSADNILKYKDSAGAIHSLY